jgi:hypothetical protein
MVPLLPSFPCGFGESLLSLRRKQTVLDIYQVLAHNFRCAFRIPLLDGFQQLSMA